MDTNIIQTFPVRRLFVRNVPPPSATTQQIRNWFKQWFTGINFEEPLDKPKIFQVSWDGGKMRKFLADASSEHALKYFLLGTGMSEIGVEVLDEELVDFAEDSLGEEIDNTGKGKGKKKEPAATYSFAPESEVSVETPDYWDDEFDGGFQHVFTMINSISASTRATFGTESVSLNQSERSQHLSRPMAIGYHASKPISKSFSQNNGEYSSRRPLESINEDPQTYDRFKTPRLEFPATFTSPLQQAQLMQQYQPMFAGVTFAEPFPHLLIPRGPYVFNHRAAGTEHVFNRPINRVPNSGGGIGRPR
ncbi:hypothetical protein B0J14DRAFT_663033 [Halenospora varia]|nr:hypothetical protein B0J14DRAFT_663033 [Halenospora varia]